MKDKITIDGVTYQRVVKLSGRSVIRCRNAGVHVGTVKSRDAHTLILEDANRIWRWSGANTLSEVAMQGVNRSEATRIATMVPEIELTSSDVCEVIPVADTVDLSEVWND
jgi:hypothetical protein